MKAAFRVIDDFLTHPDAVRQSALDSGFGTWAPKKGRVGSSVYTGMNYTGMHAVPIHALAIACGGIIVPNSMFFRVSNVDTERAYIHSDREMGSFTCIVYLSKHEETIGTAFWRHKRTGLVEMPTFADQDKLGLADELAADMVSGDGDKWEQTDFVRGFHNRALIFSAPLFHSRIPAHGIGTTDVDGRMIWGCHFHAIGPKGELQ